MQTLLATALVAAAVGYVAAAATALWLVDWSMRTRVIKFFFYSGSAITATGVGFAILLAPFGSFAGYTTIQWAVGFAIVQVAGMWGFVINTAIESIQTVLDGKHGVGTSGMDEPKGGDSEQDSDSIH